MCMNSISIARRQMQSGSPNYTNTNASPNGAGLFTSKTWPSGSLIVAEAGVTTLGSSSGTPSSGGRRKETVLLVGWYCATRADETTAALIVDCDKRACRTGLLSSLVTLCERA